jgi:SET domain
MFCSESCLQNRTQCHGAECSIFQKFDVAFRTNLNCDIASPDHVLKSSKAIRYFFESLEAAAGSLDRIENLMKEGPMNVFDFDFGNDMRTTLAWDRLRSVFGLLPETDLSYENKYKKDIKSYIAHISKTHNWSARDQQMVLDFILHMMLISQRNNWSVLGSDRTVSGTNATYLFGSLTNHSCVPNTGVVSLGARQVQFVLKPIKKNEQIFVTYSHG